MWRLVEQRFEEAVACLALAVIAICVFLQVTVRYFLGVPLLWTEEVCAIAMAWAVYMGAAYAVRERFHIRILAVVMLFPRRVARVLVVLADGVWLAFLVLMLAVSLEYLALLAEQTSRTPVLSINELYPQSVEPIGYGLMIARLAQLYVAWWRAGARDIPGMRAEHELEPA